MNALPAVPEVARGSVAKDAAVVGSDGRLAQPRTGIRNMLRTVLLAWRGITRQQVRATLVIGVVVCVGLFTFLGVPLDSPGRVLLTAVASQLRVFSLLLAFVVADRVTAGDPSRRGPYVWAVLVGSAVATALPNALGEVANLVWEEYFANDTVGDWSIWFYVYGLGDTILIAGATVWVILDRRRAAFARERMLGAELDRIAAERRSIESDLQAMQARVEPQFLFHTLAQVERLYADDAAQAGDMLDALISYLRAAMPLMRDTSSTVGREIELARAYLEIVRLRLGERLSFAIEAPPGADGIRMPPMMLLPLIDHAIVHGHDSTAGAGAIRIGTEVGDGRLRLTIRDSGVGFAPDTDGDGIAALRERLDALYGSNARLELRRTDPGATEAVLDLPLESSAAADEQEGAPSTGGAP